MSYKVIGSYDIKGKLNVQGKTPGVSVSTKGSGNVYEADENGHVEIPIPQQSDIDVVFENLPLSQYGSLNDVPVGVDGTFDGGSTMPFYSHMPVLMEEDGTVAFLRPGSNGSTINYYYTYLSSPNTSTVPVTSIKKYYNGNSRRIVFFDSYAKDVLIYQDIDNKRIYVSLTNGTLDNTFHQQAYFDVSLIPHHIMSAVKVNSYIYIMALYNSTYNKDEPIRNEGMNINDPFQFLVYRIPVSQIQSGTITTVEQVTGNTGNTMYNEVNSSGNIRIANLWASSVSSSSTSFFKFPSGTNIYPITYSIIGAAKSYFDGTNIIFSFFTNCAGTNNNGRYDTTYGLTVTYNVSTKTYSTDLSATPVTLIGASTGVLTWNNPYSVTSAITYGFGAYNSDGNSSSWFITDNGDQYAVKEKYVGEDYYIVTKCKISNYSTQAEAYKVRNRQLTLESHSFVYSDFASRVGDQLIGGSPIKSDRIFFTGTGTYDGKTYTKYYRGIADIGTTRNYTYKSIERGTITGYAPQVFRVPFGDTNEPLMKCKLSFCDTANTIQSYGTVFLENTFLSAGYQFNPNTLVYDRTIKIENSTLVNLKNSIFTNLGLPVPPYSTIGLYYSPRNDYCKSIACVTTQNGPNAGGRIIMATVDCVLTSNTVTSAILNSVIYNTFLDYIQSIPSTDEMKAHSGLSCVKYPDFTYISFSHLSSIVTPGDSNEFTACGIVNSNGSITNLTVSSSYHVAGIAPYNREYSYIPNLGFGYYLYGNTDSGTKLIFRNCGNTLAQFNSNIVPGTGTDVVILAQDVTEGFVLYFTERTPLFMNGKYYELPVSTIDLNTITENPGNLKYYIYVQIVNDVAQYKATFTQIAESETNMFIGTIQTDGTKISSLNINKTSRFGNFRPSEAKIGSAFPVSTGNPLDPGTISW